jgi:RNA polymerase sigma factor (TIGR02999 family)
MEPQEGEVTRLLKAWGSGDRAALDRLIPLLYHELHRMAGRHLHTQQLGNTLQTTALVHEAYLNLVDVKNVDWQHRAQFFAICAQIMRRILVDAARARAALKRGGGAQMVNVDETALLSPDSDGAIVALDARWTSCRRWRPGRPEL